MLKTITPLSSILQKTLLYTFLMGIDISMIGCSANRHADGKLIQNVSGDFRVGGLSEHPTL